MTDLFWRLINYLAVCFDTKKCLLLALQNSLGNQCPLCIRGFPASSQTAISVRFMTFDPETLDVILVSFSMIIKTRSQQNCTLPSQTQKILSHTLWMSFQFDAEHCYTLHNFELPPKSLLQNFHWEKIFCAKTILHLIFFINLWICIFHSNNIKTEAWKPLIWLSVFFVALLTPLTKAPNMNRTQASCIANKIFLSIFIFFDVLFTNSNFFTIMCRIKILLNFNRWFLMSQNYFLTNHNTKLSRARSF